MNLRILIVDDSPAMRSFIRRTLVLAGLPIRAFFTAPNGAEALQVLNAETIDLVLTDINMPVMDGTQFVQAMQEDPKLRDIPVLVISTDSTHARVSAMLALGAKAYVKKPFSPETLREEIERVLGVTL